MWPKILPSIRFFRPNSEAAPPCHGIKQVFWRLFEETPMAGYGKEAIMRIAESRGPIAITEFCLDTEQAELIEKHKKCFFIFCVMILCTRKTELFIVKIS